LGGNSITATELGYLDGAPTDGTTIASKVVVTDSNNDVTIGRNLDVTGTLNSVTTAELAYLSGAPTDGTTIASKVVVTSSTNSIVIPGDLTVSGTLSPSDRRLKTNIQVVGNSLDKINRLNGVYFKWDKSLAENKEKSDDMQIGLIAQEVLDVLPDLVKETLYNDKQNYYRVNYVGLIPVIVEAVKEIVRMRSEDREQLQALRTRVAAIEAYKLHSRVAAIETLLTKNGNGNIVLPTHDTLTEEERIDYEDLFALAATNIWMLPLLFLLGSNAYLLCCLIGYRKKEGY